MGRVTFTFRNETGAIQDVFVEPWPEYFKIRPGETLALTFEPMKSVASALDVVAHSEGISLYPNFEGVDVDMTIDGKAAEDRSWAD